MDRKRKPLVASTLPAWMACCAFLLGACSHAVRVAPDNVAGVSVESAYTGFALGRDADGGAVVLDVIAGPAALAGFHPGDRIVAASGTKVDAAGLLDSMRSWMPGMRVPMRLVRDSQELDVVLVVGNLRDWASPAAYSSRVAYVDTPARTETVWLDDAEAKVADAAPDVLPARDRLQRMFDELARDPRGFNMLATTRRALADPGSLVALERRLVKEMNPANGARERLVPMLCEILDIECDGLIREPPGVAEKPPLDAFAKSIAAINLRVRSAFPAGTPRDRLFGDLRYLLSEIATKRTLIYQTDSLRGIHAMQASMHVDFAALLDAFDQALALASNPPRAQAATHRKLPAALAAMVEGEILDYAEVDGGYVVIGGPGPNRYRMDRLYAVIDTGGDDTYTWGEGLPLESQVVIDLAGNDRYESRVGGPGAGWLGVSVLMDMGGDDNYVSQLGGCGAGAFGFGLLFDAAGADVYRCDAWSIGTGIYGGGVLMDAGDGWDVYESQSLSQGVGGPAGAGLLIDAGGDDLYRANGPVPSTYDTPTTYMSFSQGVGFGIRPYDQGGFGALIDYGGNDRYEGGEFSQGGGYFWAVGMLHDESGNDLYYGGRYTQGFAAHQAAGLFSDMAGDDVYWAMRAAAQGAAWDQSVAMMFDGGGNDFYRAESLAQGAAAQQSRAWLFDAGGNDVYWASGESTQGAAGDNSYHFLIDDPVFSLGVLVDAGGDDRYSSGLASGDVRIRRASGDAQNGRGNAGVAIDLP
ncbi:MAG TPA: PDZ domain-containing protein [Burkholderiales bacterium]|nr:PDZ domain-containing protein [Burkholderiales bacterium]